MTEMEAVEALRQLSEYYREPVMPVGRYCAALKTWAECIKALPRDDAQNKYRQGHEYVAALQQMENDIRKSSLLYRLIYLGEELRTKPCPAHNGRWSGIAPCPEGCDSYGWLP